MPQLDVSLPDGLKAWADARVAGGRYGSASDYVRDLMRRDQEDSERLDRLQAAIEEGRTSGRSDRTLQDIVANRCA